MPRVLITNGEDRQGLAACRALSDAGYAVSCASTLLPAAVHLSRFCRRRYEIPDPGLATSFIPRLVEILERDPHDVVLPGNDASLLAMSEYREHLEPLARFGFPPHDRVVASLDKIHLLRAAEAAGVPAPRSRVCADRDGAAEAAREIGYPVALKPGESFVSLNGHRQRRTTSIAGDERDLERVVPDLGSPFLVQEVEPDPVVVSSAGVMADGRLRAFATSRYERT